MTESFDCKTAEQSISAYVDGELNESECERLTAHLNTCVSCREFLNFMRFMIDGVTKTAVEPPMNLCDDIMAKVRTENVTPISKKKGSFLTLIKGRTITYVVAAACAIILLSPTIMDMVFDKTQNPNDMPQAISADFEATTESIKSRNLVDYSYVLTEHEYNTLDELPVIHTNGTYRAIIMFTGSELPKEVVETVGISNDLSESFLEVDELKSIELLECAKDLGISLSIFDDVHKYPKLSASSNKFLFYFSINK